MTRYLAVTTCNADQWTRFGRAMATTFCRHWPGEVPLRLYAEGFRDAAGIPVELVGLDAAAPWLEPWKVAHRSPQYMGGSNRRDYRRDACRFVHKVAALGAAAEVVDCDVLIWIDADVVTHAQVTVEWLKELFPDRSMIAWLDRERTYPECGFVMFRMPAALPLIRGAVEMYRSSLVFGLPEWHDSFVFQHVVKVSGVMPHSLSGPEGRKHIGHPWCSSRLAEKMDHLKGEIRKAHGRSLPQDIKTARSERYWQGAR